MTTKYPMNESPVYNYLKRQAATVINDPPYLRMINDDIEQWLNRFFEDIYWWMDLSQNEESLAYLFAAEWFRTDVLENPVHN